MSWSERKGVCQSEANVWYWRHLPSYFILAMNKSDYIVLLLVFLPAIQSLTCSNSVALSGSSCVFNFNNTDNTCSSFNFTYCRYYECTQWMKTRSSEPACTHYTLRNVSDWKSCTSTCCDNSVGYAENWESVSSCQQTIDERNSSASKKRTILIVVFSVVGGISLVVGFLLSFYCNGCKDRPVRAAHPQTAQQRQQQRLRRLEHQPRDAPEQSSSQSESVLEYNWVQPQHQLQKLKEACIVCLEPGVSLQLQCGHCYHRRCVVECVRRKKECVLCRAVSINNIKVYCDGCLKSYITTTLANHMAQLAGEVLKCPRCQQQILIEVD